MRVDVVTLFPEIIRGGVSSGVIGRAVEHGLVQVSVWNPRDYATDRHRTVDDRPYGGGPGMIMKVEPLRAAIDAARRDSGSQARTVYLSPQGRRLDHDLVRDLAAEPALLLVAGRYEGVDERLLEIEIDEEVSIGDFVLSGGELPALVVVDAVARQIPGVLGHRESAAQDSFSDGLLDWPQFTRPEEIDGRRVPNVLLGGDHEAVRCWRLKQALGRTWLRRPDLLAERGLSEEEQRLLDEFIEEHREQHEMTSSRAQ